MNQAMRGLAGRTFLNRPKAMIVNAALSKFVLENFNYSTLPGYIFMFRLLMIGMSGLTMTEWILTDFFMP
jgi:hypothetical protein